MNTEAILDNKISLMLKSSNAMPRAPEDLVERTAARMKAIERGVKAENRLSELEKSPGAYDKTEVFDLAAESTVGRMAQHRELDNYLPGKDGIKAITQDQNFRKAVENKEPGELLSDIESGKLAKEVANNAKPRQNNTEFNRQASRIKDNKPMSI